MPHLFEPLKIRDITLRNRIGVSPMCQYSSADGHATDWHLVHLGARAVGGAGLVLAEATAVAPEGRISPGDAGLWSDAQVAPLTRVLRFVKQHGAVPGVQIAHAGRKASSSRPWEGDAHLPSDAGGWDVLGPSAQAFGGRLTKLPREMTIDDIRRVQRAFGQAAERALAAGCEWLEFHAAHGYLAHSFYSPLVNRRADDYGGSFDNRVRFALETAQALRRVWPERLPMSVRISCSDWLPGGWTLDDSVELSRRFAAAGIDLIDCSSGFATPDYKQIPFAPGFQVPFSERIRRETGVKTAAVGMISDPRQADEIIRNEQADLVLLARGMLADAYWPYHAARELNADARGLLPVQYGHWLK